MYTFFYSYLNRVMYLCMSLFIFACSTDSKINEVESAKPKVLVVGAGIAGLKAASDLKKKGYDVVVLEAQSKVGGRLKTNRSLGIPFDEGASWIHGSNINDHPITALADKAGLKLFETLEDYDNSAVFDMDGRPYTVPMLTKQESMFEQLLEDVAYKGSGGQSVKDVLETINTPESFYPRIKDYMLTAYLEFSLGGDISLLSSTYFYDDEEYEGREMLVTNGYDKLANYLVNDLDVRLSTAVSSIDYLGKKLMVNSRDGRQFSADAVVVTVPLGVLQKGAIKFNPVLPEAKQTAIQHLHMGNVNKFLLIWEESFWDEQLQYIGYTNSSEQAGRFNYFMNINKFSPAANALMTFAFGDQADITESLSDEQIIHQVLAHLRSIYGDKVPVQKPKLLRTKWRQNIYSYGAYSYVGVGGSSDDFDVLAEPVADKIYFAGEHTSREYRASVHGAYLSGQRAAEEVDARFR